MYWHAAYYDGKLVGVFESREEAMEWTTRPWKEEVSWTYDPTAWDVTPATYTELTSRPPLAAGTIGLLAERIGVENVGLMVRALREYAKGDRAAHRYVDMLAILGSVE